MIKRLNVFVGAETNNGEVISADTEELKEMGMIALRNGWVLGKDLKSVLDVIEHTKPDILEVAGGLAGCCVAIAIEKGINIGIDEIVVRGSQIRSKVNNDPIMALKNSLGKNAENPRLKIIT